MSELGEIFKALRKDRRDQRQPSRMMFAIEEIKRLGYDVTVVGDTTIMFDFRGEKVRFYPYTGWFTGKTVNDGRGIAKLIKQIKKGGKD